MNWIQVVLSAVATGTTVGAVAGLLARESFKSLLDARLERLKHDLHVTAKTRELAINSQIEYKERQLAEFYGPIYARLKRGRPVYDLWTKGRLQDIRQRVVELFTQANADVVQIILTKSHLIDGEDIPASFLHYLTHVAVWDAYLAQNMKGVPLSEDEFPEAYYPKLFESEVFSTTERLKRELYALYRELGLPSAAGPATSG